MADGGETPQAEALITRIEAEVAEEIAKIEAAARSDAAEIVKAAYRGAARQMHDVVTGLRETERGELTRAEAEADTALRQMAQTNDLLAISEGMPMLRQALVDSWQEPHSRREWALRVLEIACLRLTPEKWQVEHPSVWSEEDAEDLALAILVRTGIAPDVVIDDTIVAGIRIRADAACLDGTIDTILADHSRISAMLLSELERQRSEGTS